MNPLHPQDAFGTTQVAALLLLGIDALAQDVESMANHAQTRAFVEPDELDFALVGLCALGVRVREFGQNDHRGATTVESSWPTDISRALR